MTFTTNELIELLISILVITFIYIYVFYSFKISLLIFFFVFIITTISFAFHELAHRITAIKNGFIARYKMYEDYTLMSLFLTILFKFSSLPFIILATGAVEVYPTQRARYDKMWLIAAAGPITNIIVAIISLLILLLGPKIELLIVFFYTLGYLNTYLAFFNLLPMPPLDGSKIAPQRPDVWIVLFIISIIMNFVFLII